MQCTWIETNGKSCESMARVGELCMYHNRIAQTVRQGIFALSMAEVCERVERLTRKQLEALDYLSQGQTYEVAARCLGVTENSLSQRVTHAKVRAGAKNRSELVALYSIWRKGKAGVMIT